jgi:hypothetical protein
MAHGFALREAVSLRGRIPEAAAYGGKLPRERYPAAGGPEGRRDSAASSESVEGQVATLTPERLKVDSVEDVVKRVLAGSRKARVGAARKAGFVAVREADLNPAQQAVRSAARGTPQQAEKTRPITRQELEQVAGDRNVRGTDDIVATMKAQRLIREGKL